MKSVSVPQFPTTKTALAPNAYATTIVAARNVHTDALELTGTYVGAGLVTINTVTTIPAVHAPTAFRPSS